MRSCQWNMSGAPPVPEELRAPHAQLQVRRGGLGSASSSRVTQATSDVAHQRNVQEQTGPEEAFHRAPSTSEGIWVQTRPSPTFSEGSWSPTDRQKPVLSNPMGLLETSKRCWTLTISSKPSKNLRCSVDRTPTVHPAL